MREQDFFLNYIWIVKSSRIQMFNTFLYLFFINVRKTKLIKVYLPNNVKWYMIVALMSFSWDWNEVIYNDNTKRTVVSVSQSSHDYYELFGSTRLLRRWTFAIYPSPSLENPVESYVLLEPPISSSDWFLN